MNIKYLLFIKLLILFNLSFTQDEVIDTSLVIWGLSNISEFLISS